MPAKPRFRTAAHVAEHAGAPLTAPAPAPAPTLARADARTDARTDARPSVPAQPARPAGGPPVVDPSVRRDELRLLTADALALAAAHRTAADRASVLLTRLDRMTTLSHDEVTGVLAMNGVTRDMLRDASQEGTG